MPVAPTPTAIKPSTSCDTAPETTAITTAAVNTPTARRHDTARWRTWAMTTVPKPTIVITLAVTTK